MKIIFLTLVNIGNINDYGIYTDLIRQFLKKGHHVDVVCPSEQGEETKIIPQNDSCRLLRVSTGKVQKTSSIRKGIETILIESRFKNAVAKNLTDIKYDLVLYSTPPITLAGVVSYIKQRDNAKSYLLLKDIFPQNAVDLGMMTTQGPKSVLYKYFRRKEKQLYALSDRIGCMSQANVDYVLAHNPEISPDKVEVCPNSVEVRDLRLNEEERAAMRNKYGIPLDKTVFVYGGNLGKPQGIPFLISCLQTQEQNPDAYFLIVGSGTEFGKLQAYFDSAKPSNMKLMRSLPKEDYDRMIAACDVGMIFLDHRFTIPNFPSRLLSYMQVGLPVLACTDPNTDIGKVIVDGGFGWWCESDDVNAFATTIDDVFRRDRKNMGSQGGEYLSAHYTVEGAYNRIIKGEG